MSEHVRELRMRLIDKLPEDLNTDFQLQRWIDAYEEDLERCVSKVEEYLEIRKMLGYSNRLKSSEDFYQHPLIRKYGRFLTQTKLTKHWMIKDHDNGIVFVEMPIENPQKFLKVIRVSDYLRVFFGYCEHLQSLVLENEKRSGRRSYAVCIFDMKDCSLLSYMNPFGAINKLMLYRIHMWLDYFSELLKRIIIVNSPALLPAMQKVMTTLLPPKTLDRFIVAKNLPNDLLSYLPIDSIPIAYGGKLFIPNSMDNTCIRAEPITQLHYQKNGQIWQRNTVSALSEVLTVKAGGEYRKTFNVIPGQILLYEYLASGDLQFWICQDNQIITPKFNHTTLKLTEEGEVHVNVNGILSINILNGSKTFSLKVNLSYAIV